MKNRVALLVAAAAAILGGVREAGAASVFIDFEPAGYVAGESVHNHKPDGTEAVPSVFSDLDQQAWLLRTNADEEIVDLGGNKVWRLSQGIGTGSLGNAPQSPHMGSRAGETGATNDAGRGPVTSSVFYGQFDFRSATGAPQAGLEINVTGQSYDQRQGYVRILDDGAGFDVGFFDTVEDDFQFTLLDLDLAYDEWHTIGIEILFQDGLASGALGDSDAIGNDVVNIYVNGAIVHTGTSWESYLAEVHRVSSVDTLGFSGATLAAQLGGGLYFDNILVQDFSPAVQTVPLPAAAWAGLLMLGGLAAARRVRRRDA